MHDVVRDVAISISLSQDGSRFLVKAGCGLDFWPRISPHEDYSAISLMRNEIYVLPKRLVCSKLQILLLQGNSINEIPNPFFQSPNELRVLDLSETRILNLPSSLSLLTNLQALYLDECKTLVDVSILGNLKNLQILSLKNFGGTHPKTLPQEIGYLTNLKMLDVTGACFERVTPEVISNLNGLEELHMKCDFCDWAIRTEDGSLGFRNTASFDEIIGLSRLNSLKVHMYNVNCLPRLVGFRPNWVNFNISIITKEFLKQSYYGRFFEKKLTVKMEAHRHLSRYLTLNTSMKYLPDWFIDVVTTTTEILEYTGYKRLQNILVEYDHGRLRAVKYLGIIECKLVGELMDSTYAPRIPVFESLIDLYLEGVEGLWKLCNGELPAGSLCNLKLLNVRNCPDLEDALLTSNLLPGLNNLEILHCEYSEYARNKLDYMFEFEFLDKGKIVLPKLREITLCYLQSLRSICCGHPPSGVFRNLNSLAIYGCHKLKYLFEYHVALSLSQLELLWVEECSFLETVIELSRITESNEVVFPKLKEMYLNSLPHLKWIYERSSVQCPSLEHLYVCFCHRLANLATADFQSRNDVQANDEGHFAIIFERLFHRQYDPEKVPQFFSKKESDFSTGSSI